MKELNGRRTGSYFLIITICISLLGIGLDQVEYSQGLSGTNVNGIISSNTTWTNTSDPYIVTGNVLVHENATLNIDPGVEIKFKGFYYIKIEGSIKAIGSELEPITFTSISIDPEPGDWNSIDFSGGTNGSDSLLDHCVIQYAQYGIYVHDQAPRITNNSIRYCDNRGLYIQVKNSHHPQEFDSLLIENNTISNNVRQGIDIVCISASPSIKNNIIHSNGQDGIEVSGGLSYPIIFNNTIRDNLYGITHTASGAAKIFNNLIVNNHYHGILTYDPILRTTLIYNNSIAKNQYGISIRGGNDPKVNYNNILENNEYNVRSNCYYDVNATLNYWGTTNVTAINGSIFDYYDDYNYGIVYFEPLLESFNKDSPPYQPNRPPVADAGSDQTGEIDDSFGLNGNGSRDPDGDILYYYWDLGDGTTKDTHTSSRTTHHYTESGNYTVTLTVSDGLMNDSDTCIVRVGEVNGPPLADAGPDKTTQVNEDVDLDASASYDPDGDPLKFKWEFGDGSSTDWQDEDMTSHTYSSVGEYLVTLSVSDGQFTVNDTCQITVVTLNREPVAIIGSEKFVEQWEVVTFSARGSYDLDDDELEFKWDLGDGNHTSWSLKDEVVHIYPISGQYLVQLSVTDGVYISSASCLVIVNETIVEEDPPIENDPPVAIAMSKKLRYTTTEMVELNGSKSYDPDGDEISYQWLSNKDGIIGRTDTIQTFLTYGSHLITLEVIDTNGQMDKDTINIEIVALEMSKDIDKDGIDDRIDAFPYDPNEWKDTDGDGVGDNSDAFPTDPAASRDGDNDGYPDLWNPGMSEENSTLGLSLDLFPYDKERYEEERVDDRSMIPTFVYGFILLFFIFLTILLLVQNRKIGRDSRLIRKYRIELSKDDDDDSTNAISRNGRMELLKRKREENKITPETYEEIEDMIIRIEDY